VTGRFGLSLAEIRGAVAPLSVDIQSEQQLLTLFARAVWSSLTEPGDSLAGWFVGIHGARHSLERLASGVSGLQTLNELDSQGSPLPSEAQVDEALARWRNRLNSSVALTKFSAAGRLEMTLVTPEMDTWPHQLTDLGSHAPLALWTRGDVRLLSRLSAAVVGSRAATGYGEHVTAEITRGLVSANVVITSGGAYGIDGVAHRAALAAQGATVGIFAGGLDRLYPSGHERLFAEILERGLLCAELPPGSSPTKWRFLQRNRIIAALTSATVVCEAGHRSGSLNTAGHAAQLSRPIGAVPGPVTSAASSGCHRLLREYDAVCVRSASDVLELLNPMQGAFPPSTEEQVQSSQNMLSQEEVRVLDALSPRSPRSVETLAQASGMSTFGVTDALAELDLRGMVTQRVNGWLKRVGE